MCSSETNSIMPKSERTPREKELLEKWEFERQVTELKGEKPKLIESSPEFQQAIIDLEKGKGKPVSVIEHVKAIKCVETDAKEKGWDKCAVFNTANEVSVYEGVNNVLLEPKPLKRLLSSDRVLFVEFESPQKVILYHKTPNIADFNPEMLTIAKTKEEKKEMGQLKSNLKQAEAFNRKGDIKDDPSETATLKTMWFEAKEKQRKIEDKEMIPAEFDKPEEEIEKDVEEMLRKMGLI